MYSLLQEFQPTSQALPVWSTYSGIQSNSAQRLSAVGSHVWVLFPNPTINFLQLLSRTQATVIKLNCCHRVLNMRDCEDLWGLLEPSSHLAREAIEAVEEEGSLQVQSWGEILSPNSQPVLSTLSLCLVGRTLWNGQDTGKVWPWECHL